MEIQTILFLKVKKKCEILFTRNQYLLKKIKKLKISQGTKMFLYIQQNRLS